MGRVLGVKTGENAPPGEIFQSQSMTPFRLMVKRATGVTIRRLSRIYPTKFRAKLEKTEKRGTAVELLEATGRMTTHSHLHHAQACYV